MPTSRAGVDGRPAVAAATAEAVAFGWIGSPVSREGGPTMLVTGSSQTGFDEALKDAMEQQPTNGDVPRRYEIVRSWVDTGGVVGTWYRCDVAVTGPDVPDADQV